MIGFLTSIFLNPALQCSNDYVRLFDCAIKHKFTCCTYNINSYSVSRHSGLTSLLFVEGLILFFDILLYSL